MREEAVDADIREVVEDPGKYGGKKVRIVGSIASYVAFAELAYPEVIDVHGERLGIFAEFTYGTGAFGQADNSKKESDGKAQQMEFLGYLDWGGYFGFRGAWSKMFHIVEVYPASADKAQKAEIKRRCLKQFEESVNNRMIPDLVETPEIRRVREALQGSWTVIEVDNLSQHLCGGVGSHWSISGDHFKTGSPGEWSRGTFRIDPRRTPAAIDCQVADSPYRDRTLWGIYSLEGDTFKICFAGNSGRPKEFAADRDSETALVALHAIPQARRPPSLPITGPRNPTTPRRSPR